MSRIECVIKVQMYIVILFLHIKQDTGLTSLIYGTVDNKIICRYVIGCSIYEQYNIN